MSKEYQHHTEDPNMGNRKEVGRAGRTERSSMKGQDENELQRKRELEDNHWNRLAEHHLRHFPETEKECRDALQQMQADGFKVAAAVFALAMARIHSTVGMKTGYILGPPDWAEGPVHLK